MLIVANMRNSLKPKALTMDGVTLESTKLNNHWDADAVARPKCRVRVGKISATYTQLETCIRDPYTVELKPKLTVEGPSRESRSRRKCRASQP